MYWVLRVIRTFVIASLLFLALWSLPKLAGFGPYTWVILGISSAYALLLDWEWSQRRRTRTRIPSVVREHYPVLSRKLHQATRFNDYGTLVRDDRRAVLLEFIESTNLYVPKGKFEAVATLILQEVSAVEDERMSQGFDPTMLPGNGLDFEHWVAEAFERFGWTAVPTVSTGDQGIDVIVEKAGKKIGIQTKLFSRPVGNKAVQEAYAGKQYHGLDKASVLSNAGYTRGARELAATNGVVLLSPHDIPHAEKLLLS